MLFMLGVKKKDLINTTGRNVEDSHEILQLSEETVT